MTNRTRKLTLPRSLRRRVAQLGSVIDQQDREAIARVVVAVVITAALLLATSATAGMGVRVFLLLSGLRG